MNLLDEDRLSDNEGGARGESPYKDGISISICTYKRAHSVECFLSSLDEQTRLPDVLLIVDASPDAETENTLHDFVEATQPTYDVEYLRVAGGLRGLINQRNLALALARQRILCFFDDDVTLGAEALEQIEAAFWKDTELVGVGGADQRHSRGMDQLPRRWRLRRLFNLWSPEEIGHIGKAGVAIPWSLAVPFKGEREVEVLSGYAMCWHMDKIRGLYFDEELKGPTANGEEIEFCLRARSFGKKVILGDMPIHHHTDPAGRVPSYEKAREAGRNYPRIYARHVEHSSRSLAYFVLWQFLDVSRFAASAVGTPERFWMAVGRCMGLASFVRTLLASKMPF